MNERIKLLIQYLAEDPEDAFSRYALALEYISQQNDNEAAVLMERLYHRQPDYLPNYYHFGKLNERIGKHYFAKEIYSKGMQLAGLQGNLHTLNELRGALELLDSE
jgi:Tfp pilus assembly protein PilF